jgi:hypothetical protein
MRACSTRVNPNAVAATAIPTPAEYELSMVMLPRHWRLLPPTAGSVDDAGVRVKAKAQRCRLAQAARSPALASGIPRLSRMTLSAAMSVRSFVCRVPIGAADFEMAGLVAPTGAAGAGLVAAFATAAAVRRNWAAAPVDGMPLFQERFHRGPGHTIP